MGHKNQEESIETKGEEGMIQQSQDD